VVHRSSDFTATSRRRVTARIALAALAAVLAVALTGCGRKGGLDPPPMAAADQPQAGQPGRGPAVAPAQPANQPSEPSAPKRSTWLDWLIN
jgi:predicted small lipoprotein YifL